MPVARPLALVALLAAVASAQTAPTSAPATSPATSPAALVDNPPFLAWAKVPIGSSVESTMTGNRNGTPMSLTMVSTLDRVGADSVTLSTAVTLPGMPTQTQSTDVPAKVEEAALYNFQKIPGIARRVVGNADVVIDGKTFPCRLLELTGSVQNMPVKISVWETTDIPGGFAKLHATLGPNGMNVDVQKIRVKS